MKGRASGRGRLSGSWCWARDRAGTRSRRTRLGRRRASLAVTYVDFGNVVIGDARTDAGGGLEHRRATLRATLRSPCAEFAVEGDSILDVAAGRSASFRVTFAPSAEGGHSCVLAEAIGGCGDVTCAGFGAATACAVIPDRLDFGPVPVFATADRIVTIRNAGRTTLSGVIYSPCPDFAVSPTASRHPGRGSATVIVRFAPIVGDVDLPPPDRPPCVRRRLVLRRGLVARDRS